MKVIKNTNVLIVYRTQADPPAVKWQSYTIKRYKIECYALSVYVNNSMFVAKYIFVSLKYASICRILLTSKIIIIGYHIFFTHIINNFH